MSSWWNRDQEEPTNSKGWGADIKKAHEEVLKKYKTKIKKIVGGMKATPAIIKRTFGKK
jgi:hypothetical protein